MTAGNIRKRGSGDEVRVSAGRDPITKKPKYLTATCRTVEAAEFPVASLMVCQSARRYSLITPVSTLRC
ncbi:hypothetical protein [Mangrovactinospora gilvigrisea]|uniref:hypothetical protein n=1 Tax=Mangrovactinospora gilvigrisea TaxID=1428644 RepID=UPI000A9D24A7|nr:hypothetical protein [Mangrovactinospora gilvigrisea]